MPHLSQRIDWDPYFALMARMAATRATCLRRQVGAILVHGKRMVAEGYNGSKPGEPHCLDVGCQLNEQGACTRTIHAERNAIDAYFEEHGDSVDTSDFSLYTTVQPCADCKAYIQDAGIPLDNVFWLEAYPEKRSVGGS